MRLSFTGARLSTCTVYMSTWVLVFWSAENTQLVHVRTFYEIRVSTTWTWIPSVAVDACLRKLHSPLWPRPL